MVRETKLPAWSRFVLMHVALFAASSVGVHGMGHDTCPSLEDLAMHVEVALLFGSTQRRAFSPQGHGTPVETQRFREPIFVPTLLKSSTAHTDSVTSQGQMASASAVGKQTPEPGHLFVFAPQGHLLSRSTHSSTTLVSCPAVLKLFFSHFFWVRGQILGHGFDDGWHQDRPCTGSVHILAWMPHPHAAIVLAQSTVGADRLNHLPSAP
mmetsp:Transcript_17243/g.37749  ORF Transcript_17243/g.37749 Transcript_17243/m.37749 type:complete len:209 (-) Transcript_17243:2294-2920(-)